MSKTIKISLGLILGAAAGYAYYYFIGCNSGNCPITSNWEVSTMYGAFMGLVAAFPMKKKEKSEDEPESDK